MEELEKLEKTLRDDIEIIDKYINMLLPITNDGRAWLRTSLKEEADENLKELEIRKTELETVLKHIYIQKNN